MIVNNFTGLIRAFRTKKLFIFEAKDSVSLQFNIAAVQSEMCPDFPNKLVLGYTQTMMGFLLFNPEPTRIGMIGLGGGSLPKYCFAHLPNSSITVVEINPDVIELSKHFHVPENGPRFNVICGDGADFVKEKTSKFDVLIVDGFNDSGQPEQLCSQEFYDDCYELLAPQGILVVNLLGPDQRSTELIKRISTSFHKEVLALNAYESHNTIAFAFKDDLLSLPEHVLLGRLGSLELDHMINLSLTCKDFLRQRRLRKNVAIC
jgi:spermidine synthase